MTELHVIFLIFTVLFVGFLLYFSKRSVSFHEKNRDTKEHPQSMAMSDQEVEPLETEKAYAPSVQDATPMDIDAHTESTQSSVDDDSEKNAQLSFDAHIFNAPQMNQSDVNDDSAVVSHAYEYGYGFYVMTGTNAKRYDMKTLHTAMEKTGFRFQLDQSYHYLNDHNEVLFTAHNAENEGLFFDRHQSDEEQGNVTTSGVALILKLPLPGIDEVTAKREFVRAARYLSQMLQCRLYDPHRNLLNEDGLQEAIFGDKSRFSLLD